MLRPLEKNLGAPADQPQQRRFRRRLSIQLSCSHLKEEISREGARKRRAHRGAQLLKLQVGPEQDSGGAENLCGVVDFFLKKSIIPSRAFFFDSRPFFQRGWPPFVPLWKEAKKRIYSISRLKRERFSVFMKGLDTVLCLCGPIMPQHLGMVYKGEDRLGKGLQSNLRRSSAFFPFLLF